MMTMSTATAECEGQASSPPLRVIEFYSGAGGFHFALLASGAESEVVASFDINTNANQVYEHNFPNSPHFNRNICGLTAQELDSLNGDVFVLSPPCQPFTRQGLRRDNADRRTDSFFHLMSIMEKMGNLPSFILTENVQGFEVSNTRENYVTLLTKLGYSYQEFLLSPTEFGVPNSRLRYYLLAKKLPLQFSLEFVKQPCKDPRAIISLVASQTATPTQSTECQASARTADPDPQTFSLNSSGSPSSTVDPLPSAGTTPLASPISTFLEPLTEAQVQCHLVPEAILSKYAIALDIVSLTSTRSCCFTKAYGNYAVGTGSVLQHAADQDIDKAFKEFVACSCYQCLQPLKLRYFTPKEVANLMCFPPSFTLPPELSVRQCYKVLGNSLNVHVVSVLMKYLFR